MQKMRNENTNKRAEQGEAQAQVSSSVSRLVKLNKLAADCRVTITIYIAHPYLKSAFYRIYV